MKLAVRARLLGRELRRRLLLQLLLLEACGAGEVVDGAAGDAVELLLLLMMWRQLLLLKRALRRVAQALGSIHGRVNKVGMLLLLLAGIKDEITARVLLERRGVISGRAGGGCAVEVRRGSRRL